MHEEYPNKYSRILSMVYEQDQRGKKRPLTSIREYAANWTPGQERKPGDHKPKSFWGDLRLP